MAAATASKPNAEVIKAIELDMVKNVGMHGIAPQAAPAAAAQWIGCACISRPEEQFDAAVSLSDSESRQRQWH